MSLTLTLTLYDIINIIIIICDVIIIIICDIITTFLLFISFSSMMMSMMSLTLNHDYIINDIINHIICDQHH